MGHFGVDKTLTLSKSKFYWPHMRVDVQRFCSYMHGPSPS